MLQRKFRALPYYLQDKNVKLFTTHGVYTKEEIKARYEIAQEHYTKIVNIEALTALDMVKKDILPTVSSYSKSLADTAKAKKDLSLDATYELDILSKVSEGLKKAYEETLDLEKTLAKKDSFTKIEELSLFYKDEVLPKMASLRDVVDDLEVIVDEKVWPYPSYGRLLFGVR